AIGRVSTLRREREEAYKRVFEAIVAEEAVLRDLYKPLMTRLGKAASTLGKLSFSVSRKADIARWADAGEQLLDLRRQGPFKGRGTLHQLAAKTLETAWETGDPKTVSAAMEMFLNDNRNALLEHSPVPKADQANYREWAKKLAKWLYSTEHIAIHYS